MSFDPRQHRPITWEQVREKVHALPSDVLDEMRALPDVDECGVCEAFRLWRVRTGWTYEKDGAEGIPEAMRFLWEWHEPLKDSEENELLVVPIARNLNPFGADHHCASPMWGAMVYARCMLIYALADEIRRAA